VFPEYGLTTIGMPRDRNNSKPFLLTVPSVGTNACLENTGSSLEITDLACSAREWNIYVVVNLGEIRPCGTTDKNCPIDGVFHYNSNIVFDRRGVIIAR
jgi:hypothetical protein